MFWTFNSSISACLSFFVLFVSIYPYFSSLKVSFLSSISFYTFMLFCVILSYKFSCSTRFLFFLTCVKLFVVPFRFSSKGAIWPCTFVPEQSKTNTTQLYTHHGQELKFYFSTLLKPGLTVKYSTTKYE